ncbi:MAG TPA: SusD/RagB family nutrient-binding outer membrane lipoprotein [Chryseolinea sp.]
MKRIVYLPFVLVTLVICFSCEDYLDVNENPNNPERVSMELLLANSSFRTGDNIQAVGNITSYYVQYLASPNAFGTKDIHDPAAYDIEWQDLYRVMSDISDIEVQAREEGAPHYEGVAKVLKTINLALVLDVWGDVPYTEAFFGVELQPGYDDDKVLYDTLQRLLDEAIIDLTATESIASPGDDDFVYGGDIENWIKLAYSLKARYFLRLSNTPEFDANAVLEAVSNGIMLNSENADITYSSAGQDVYNPWATVARSQENSILDGWISEQLADAMNGKTFGAVDPRMPFMFSATDDGKFVGVRNGAGRGTGVGISGDRSVISRDTYYASDVSPILILTNSEMRFIEAEALLSLGEKPAAYDAYLAGIRAHMEMLGVAPAAIEAYINAPTVSVGATNISLDLIMKEKYVALFLHPETWNDARRFNYQYEDMTLPDNHNPELNGEYIRRQIYPDSETSRNAVNVPSVTLLDRMWWDQ